MRMWCNLIMLTTVIIELKLEAKNTLGSIIQNSPLHIIATYVAIQIHETVTHKFLLSI